MLLSSDLNLTSPVLKPDLTDLAFWYTFVFFPVCSKRFLGDFCSANLAILCQFLCLN